MVYDYGCLKGNEGCQRDENYKIPKDQLKKLTSNSPNHSEYGQKSVYTKHATAFIAVTSTFKLLINVMMTVLVYLSSWYIHYLMLSSCLGKSN